jgi:hypothetical protein
VGRGGAHRAHFPKTAEKPPAVDGASLPLRRRSAGSRMSASSRRCRPCRMVIHSRRSCSLAARAPRMQNGLNHSLSPQPGSIREEQAHPPPTIAEPECGDDLTTEEYTAGRQERPSRHFRCAAKIAFGVKPTVGPSRSSMPWNVASRENSHPGRCLYDIPVPQTRRWSFDLRFAVYRVRSVGKFRSPANKFIPLPRCCSSMLINR